MKIRILRDDGQVAVVDPRDYPLVQGTVLMIGVIVLVVNTSIEVIYGWIDPRVRLS